MVCVFLYVCVWRSVCACSLSSTLFDQGWKKITMYSLEESVGGNDRDCPCETSFPCTRVCVLVKDGVFVCMYGTGKTEGKMENEVEEVESEYE